MLLYLFAIQSVALSMTHLLTSRHLSASLTGLLVTCMALVSGYVVHFEDLGDWTSWLKYVSPQWWLGHPIHQVSSVQTKEIYLMKISHSYYSKTHSPIHQVNSIGGYLRFQNFESFKVFEQNSMESTFFWVLCYFC
jgi:hypothetical protein